MPGVNCWGMTMTVEKISAVTFKVRICGPPCGFTKMFWAWRLSTEAKMDLFLLFAPRTARPYPESRARSFGSWLGADDFLRGGCGCVLGTPAGKRTSARESARRVLGRAVFSYARSGWPRVVVCASDLAVFQQLHELILIEEQFAKRLAQHWWTHVLSGMGFPE